MSWLFVGLYTRDVSIFKDVNALYISAFCESGGIGWGLPSVGTGIGGPRVSACLADPVFDSGVNGLPLLFFRLCRFI